MNLNLNHPLRRRFMSADLDAGGTDTLDRGDDFDGEAAAAAAEAEAGKGGPAEAAAAAALEAELAAKAGEKAEEDDDKDDKVDKTKGKDTRIPLSRHEAVLNKERERRADLERQLAKFQEGTKVANLNQGITATEDAVMKMEKEYAVLLTDGKTDEASTKMAEIRKAERDMAEAKSDMKIQAAVARATESARYNTALDRIEAQYPMLNEDHEDFSAEVMAEVMELKTGYESQGYTPTQAMQKAVRKELGAATAAQVKVLDTTPRVDAADTAAALAAARKLAATKKTIAAVEGTPASTTKVGIDSDKAGGALDAKAVMKMSQEDFGKLNEETLSRMRGDTI